MELADIQERTKLPLRKLRYVLDHRILPGARVKLDISRAGHPREFTEFEGFGIALAAALLDAGLNRKLVARFFDAMTEITWDPATGTKTHRKSPLDAAFFQRLPAVVELADGRYLAVRIGPQAMEWRDLASPRLNSVTYEPWVTVAVDLARLRQAVWS